MADDKYTKLRLDLLGAASHAEEETWFANDNGTCNMDSVIIKLERYNADRVKEIAKEVELTAHKEEGPWWNICLFFGIAQRNTEAQEAMCEYLKDCGYEAYVKYCMD